MVSKHGQSFDFDDAFFKAEYEAVYRYVLSLCRNETEAGDITQDTFLKAMQAKEGFLGNSSVYTWLCAIAKNIQNTSLPEAPDLARIEAFQMEVNERVVRDET